MDLPAAPNLPNTTGRPDSKRLPSLDGLRGIGSLLVVFSHAFLQFTWLWGFAEFGVMIFFVASGYLITYLLLAEKARFSRIALKAFYIRRAFRILPVIFAYLAVLVLITLAGVHWEDRRGFLGVLTFTWSLLPGSASPRNVLTNHTWSLSIEEQFYLLWPCFIAWLDKRTAKYIAAGLIALSPILRIVLYQFLDPSWRGIIGWTLYSRPDSLMFGCFLALAYDPASKRATRNTATTRVLVILSIVVLLVAGWLPTWKFCQWDSYTVQGVCAAFLLFQGVSAPGEMLGRALNWRPLVWVGTISYSVYVWQQLLFFGPGSGFLSCYHADLLAVFVVGLASYLLIEKPSILLRQRFFASTRAR